MAEVYIITNTLNGKQYVGKTIHTAEKRWQEHQNESLLERSKDRPLYAALRKYPINVFSVETYATNLTDKEATELEVKLIEKLNSFKNGYNATVGGDGRAYRLTDKEEVDEIIRLYTEEKMTMRELAKLFDVSVETISARLKENGIEIYSGGRSKWHDPISVSHKGSVTHFSQAQDFIDYLINNKITTGTEENVKRCVSRLFDGTRQTYLGFKLIK